MVNVSSLDLAQPSGRRSGAAMTPLLAAPFSRRTRAELVYLVASLPLSIAGFGLLVALLFLGAGLAVIAVGVPLVAAAVLTARQLAGLHRRLASRLLGECAEAPRPLRRGPGLLSWVRAGLGDVAGWRAVSYIMLRVPVAVAGAYVVVALWVYYGLLNLFAPMWLIYHQGQATMAARPLVLRAPTNATMLSVRTLPGTFMLSAIGIAALLTAPWAVRAVVAADRVLIRSLLGASTLSGRVRDLEQTRAYAVGDSAARLRKIERDLHDGPQVRLTALAMTLGEIKESLQDTAIEGANGGGRIRALVSAAHHNAEETLTELRQLARGIHPPVLDHGLEAALSTLAAKSAIPAGLTVAIRARPSPAIETIAYFCAAELLANVAKHSRAQHATIGVTEHDGRLLMTVTDDGSGTAHLTPDGGLAGLAERVRAVDGRLAIDSPAGGPTTITIELPGQP